MESPTAWEVFLHQGLPLTGIGMALVFLTLLIVAGVIWALGKLFRPSETDEDESEEVEEPAIVLSAVEEQPDSLGQVAAIAVALALSTPAKPAVATAGASRVSPAAAPLPWQTVADVDDEEITGEVVTVANFAGSASWKARGRLDSQE